jgi:hypothetical protein
MAAAYNELLDATIQHLEGLKARGVRHVAVAPETLRAFALPVKTIATPPPVPKTETTNSMPAKRNAAPVEPQAVVAPVRLPINSSSP